MASFGVSFPRPRRRSRQRGTRANAVCPQNRLKNSSKIRVSDITRPKLGDVVAEVGRVGEYQVVELPLDLSLEDVDELSLAIDPTSCDGLHDISREGGKPTELIVEYVE